MAWYSKRFHPPVGYPCRLVALDVAYAMAQSASEVIESLQSNHLCVTLQRKPSVSHTCLMQERESQMGLKRKLADEVSQGLKDKQS